MIKKTIHFTLLTCLSSHAQVIIIDNGDPGYSTSGMTEQLIVDPDAYRGNHAYNSTAEDLTASSTYTFENLAAAEYEVFVSWRASGQDNADIMQITVSDGGPTVTVNQRDTGPLADATFNDGTRDVNFQKIGTITVSDGNVEVTTSLGMGGDQRYFITDAIALRAPIIDTDGDGMNDEWEDMFAGLDKNDPSDRDEDILDSDGLTNFQEFERGTDPTDPDSDGDTLTDGDEFNNLGTNPTLADTDGDRLDDNVETGTLVYVSASDTGTDPLLADTDLDLVPDGVEIIEGSDPTNINSIPGTDFSGLIAYSAPTGTGGNQAFPLGLGMDFNVGDTPISLTHFGVFDDSSDGIGEGTTLTVTLWERDPIDPTFAIGQVGPAIEFTRANEGRLIAGSRFLELATPIKLPAGFQGSIVAHGFSFLTDRNVNSAAGFGDLNDGGGLISFVGTSRYGNNGLGTFPEVVDTDTPNRYAAGSFIFKADSGGDLKITSIDYDPSTSMATLTWNSAPGEQYAVEFTDDFAQNPMDEIIWTEITSNYDAQGSSTTFQASVTPAGTPRRFFRIRKN